ncbi:Putative transposase [Heliorestis convoluta]|uniref:Transposase n=1 Tax=Heliorestis convoluta TaxID=356322 RepID=A0A5Q2N4T1_9FIRM|nr:Putative transposase [Heliorestis convoluta]
MQDREKDFYLVDPRRVNWGVMKNKLIVMTSIKFSPSI